MIDFSDINQGGFMSKKAKRNPILRKKVVTMKYFKKIQQQERTEHERLSKRISK